jgi:hypothetical protein
MSLPGEPMTRKMFLAVPATLLLGASLFYNGGHTAPPTQPALVDLTPESLSTMEVAFNKAKGEVRVLALLSPT